MATEPVGKLSIVQQKEYFDRLALTWDSRLTPETLTRLSNIVAELDIKPVSCVLDVGSGTGVLVPFLNRAIGNLGTIIEVDISARMLAEAKSKGLNNTHFIQADIAYIPMPQEVFDLVICHNVFPHFGNKLKSLKEIARVTKLNGRLAICHSMSREAVNNLHQTIGGVVRNDLLPEEVELYQLLTEAGLDSIKLEDNSDRYLAVAHKKSREA